MNRPIWFWLISVCYIYHPFHYPLFQIGAGIAAYMLKGDLDTEVRITTSSLSGQHFSPLPGCEEHECGNEQLRQGHRVWGSHPHLGYRAKWAALLWRWGMYIILLLTQKIRNVPLLIFQDVTDVSQAPADWTRERNETFPAGQVPDSCCVGGQVWFSPSCWQFMHEWWVGCWLRCQGGCGEV